MDPHQKVIMIAFNGRNDNLGDVVICMRLYEACAQRNDCQVIFCGRPPHGIEAAWIGQRARYFWIMLWALKGRKIFYFPSPGGPIIFPWKMSIGHILERIIRPLLTKVFSFSSITKGPRLDDHDLRLFLSQYDVIDLRDSESRALAQGVFDNRKHFNLSTDISFSLELSAHQHSSGQRGSIALSFREEIPEDEGGFAFATSNFMSLYDALDSPKLIAQVSEDRDFMRRAIGAEGHIQSSVVLFDYTNWCVGYDAVSVVFTNRLHVALLAASRGVVPFIVTTKKHRKILALLQDVGLLWMVLEKIPSRVELDELLSESSLAEKRSRLQSVFLSERKKVEGVLEWLFG